MLYLYKCECGAIIERYEPMDSSHEECLCDCGKTAKRVYTSPSLITDTSFCMTGVRDSRLDNEVIEGRQHWKRKLKEKGYMETEYEK